MPETVRVDIKRQIIDLWRNGARGFQEIADQVGVSAHTVKKHLVDVNLLNATDDGRALNPSKAKLTNDQVLRYRCRYAAGQISAADMARELGMNLSVCCRILKGQTYSNAGGPVVSGWLRGQPRHA